MVSIVGEMLICTYLQKYNVPQQVLDPKFPEDAKETKADGEDEKI
jgi:hypothetical protein